MDIKELKSKDLEKKFQINFSTEDVSQKLNKKLQEISETTEISGFRKGKVPIDILKKQFGENALSQILDELVRTSSNEVISKNKFRLAIRPKVDVKKFGENVGLEYLMTLELLPEIEIKDYKKIKLTKYISDVAEDDFKKTLDSFAQTQQAFEKKEGKKAENGDAVLINLKPTYNGEIVKEARIENKLTILGNKMIIPEIEKRILNTKSGDKLNFEAKFPKNFPNKEVAEKNVKIEIDIIEVRVKKNNVIDDNFAKSMGSNSLQEFKDNLKKQMQKEIDNVSKMHLKKDLLDQLDKSYTLQPPKGLINHEFEHIWNTFLENKKNGKIDPEDKNKKEEDLKKEYTKIATRRVKLGLVLAEIGEKNNVSVGEDDIKKAIEEEIMRQPDEKDKILAFYRNNSEALAALKAPILEEKVVNHILGSVGVHEKKISRKELFKK